MKVDLTIIIHSPETLKFEDLNMKVGIEDYEETVMTFYQIDAVGDAVDDEGYSVIHSSGMVFLAKGTREEINNKIKEAKSKE